MRRQSYYTDPARKEIGISQDFSGGLNIMTAHDNMRDNELTKLVNMSFDERGALSRRTGISDYSVAPVEGIKNAQMYFRFYRTPSAFDEIVAADGKIYVNGALKKEGLQATRMMEAVQWYQKAFIATGSGLYEWDGTEIKPVAPYTPEPLDALYTGLNALADDPDNFLADGTGSTVQLTGVTFDKRYGIMNENFTLTAYHSKPAGTILEYKFEYRYPFEADGVYHLGQNWSESKTWTFKAEGEGDMQFRISARTKGKEISEAIYLVPKYTIKAKDDPNDIKPDLGGIKTCNRIMLHWERLIMYGDTTNINTIYISHLKNAAYFPIPNTLFFETTRTEAVNTIVKFRDYLVAFTDTSTQALFGKSPSDYRRVVLNTSIGCIASRGAAVMDNYVAFLSADGIQYLKSVGYVDDKANIAPLDGNITDMVPKNARDAVLVMYNNQLQATFPSSSERFRFYKMMGIWTYDKSPYLNNVDSIVYNNKLYHLRNNGTVNIEDSETYKDLDHVYVSEFETRYLDFGLPYHPKKLKELQILAKAAQEGQVATVRMYLDGAVRTQDVLEWEAKFVTVEEYNTFIDKLRVSGKCLRVKMQVQHTLDSYIQFLGFSLIHKLKKP